MLQEQPHSLMVNGSVNKPTKCALQETAIHQALLFDLYDRMLGEVDIVKVLNQTMEVVRQIFDTERATIYRVLEESQELESVATIGNVSRTIRVPICEDSLAGYCALTGCSLVVPDAYGDLSRMDPQLRFDQSWDRLNQFRTRDVMCAPAVFKGEVLGVVQIINSREAPFRGRDILRLESVSRFVANALHHARLYDELATLKCLEKEKAEFMRIVVHELRSPVAASKSLVAALRYTNRENESLISVLGRVEERMDELLDLVEDILYLSQVKAGRPLGEITLFDLRDETQEVYERYVDDGEMKGLSMSVNLPGLALSARMDQQAYSLILSNLISNAVKYTAAGSVEVTLRQEGTWAVIEVKDTGMGIPAEDLPNLFNEFFRASNARRSEVGGTGVGLAGAKELVERCGGDIELTSEENKGSAFVVRLPVLVERPIHPAVRSQRAQERTLPIVFGTELSRRIDAHAAFSPA
jgi:signal transduction histidine kinase